jgi:dienelactone hydrolase
MDMRVNVSIKYLILIAGLLLSPIFYARDINATLLSNAGKAHKISLPSKQPDGALIEISGYWFAAHSDKKSATQGLPVVVLMHGCGGVFNTKGELSQRMRDYPAMLNSWGYHTLVLDSLTARGEKQLCTQKIGTRKVTQAHRQLDAIAALQWLALRPEVDATRMVLLGWSNGGSSVLSATNARHEAVNIATHKPRAAVAFYPGCEAELKRGYQGTAPLLLMVGELDDWTPPEPCQALAAQFSSEAAPIEIEAMAGAYHGFDGEAALRLRTDVPNGVRPGKGVHVGRNDAAKALSQERLKAYLQRIL